MPFPEHLQHLFRYDEPLGPLTWLGIGGPARYFAEPHSRNELIEVVRTASANDIPIRVLGSGSNVLVREAGFDGLVVSLSSAALSQLHVDGRQLNAGSGAKLSHAITKAVGAGLGGLEHLTGIPGTVGGALCNNASASGGDIGSVTAGIEILDVDGAVRSLTKDQLQFSHHKTNLVGLLLLSATFDLEPQDPSALTKRLQKLWIVRRSERPVDETRTAMPFVDPDMASAAELIQQAGLAGMRCGAVSIDTSHPGYIIAHSGATSDDVLQLLERVCEQVHLQSGIDLQLNLQVW
ncbi:MAG: UDP-N-acetylmuramate dehydrogenase [Pirellulaceae bacterium]